MAEQKTQRQEKNFPDRFFGISESGSTMRTEILAGITTFFAMAYILVVNPQILSAPFIIRGETVYAAQVANGVFFATCLIAFIGTLLMAVYAKVPFAQAPGMGLNAFFAYTVVLGMGYSYQQALAMVFISGLLFIFITAIGFREACVRAIPQPVKAAMSAGIGLFLALIGLENASIVVSNGATFVGMIDFSLWNDTGDAAGMIMAGGMKYPVVEYHRMIASAIVALIGLVVTGVLFARRIRGAIFIGILVSTLAGIPFGLTALHEFSFNLTGQMQDFREISLFNMDFAGLFRNTSNLFEMALTVIMIVISFSLVDMFDTIGTLLGTAKQAKMLDGNGDMPRMKEAMMCDAIATTAGACLGSSTATVFVESSTGIAEGGRTGMTALVTSLLFLASLVIAPVITVIPAAATAPALIFVGVLMMGSVREVDFSDMTSAIPSFVTMVFMPFTYSIANGIAFGLITYVLIGLLMGRIRQIHCLTVILCLLFVLRFAFMVTG
ncbi:NCS2 family permease [Oxalobacter sp. OxGP1]|uniref:NCS2 family permease n=1 Tax=Oxalobacter paeniformigenes TaxID=2946594 RepID=UPI0022AED8FF|nr:NCS2 family permease [Oxalobacter paeniformigenes]MCZ4052834.1 NCS2 family permease [Oxalobacter paeniformigenes]